MSADYAKRAKECGLKAGDFVRLMRKAEAFEDGWDNVWPPAADSWVGHILRVDCIRYDGDVKCIWHEMQPDEDWFNFPYFVLEKVEGVGEVPEGATLEKWQTFKPGDIVRVMRSARSHENGWCNSWVPDMDSWVGKLCRVVYTNGSVGVKCENLDGTDWWNFPSFVLEKVSNAKTTPEEKKVFNIGDTVRIIGTWQPCNATGHVEVETAPGVWKVKFDTHKEGDPEWWCYPAEALERIEDEPAPEFVPFETRVLVRDTDNTEWCPAIYGYKVSRETSFPFYTVGGVCWRQCISYEGNERLLGTSKSPQSE